MNTGRRRVVQSLQRAEAEINLLARCQPLDAAQTQRLIREKWSSGVAPESLLRFAPSPDLSQLRRALESLGSWLDGGGPWASIFAERTRELLIEARIVESVGTEAFVPLAVQRFGGFRGHLALALRRLAHRWSRLPPESPELESVASDDERNPASLLRLVRAELERLDISFPVRLASPKMLARAAVDDTAVWVKPGVRLPRHVAKRIAVHEVRGHVIPRLNARRAKYGLLRCAVARADVDEEGRAIYIEEREGSLDAPRKRELGLRHLAADACQRGANFREAASLLTGAGSSLDESLAIVLRVWRGGGLAREVIYMTGYFRAIRVLGTTPKIDEWMQRGRLSFEVAAELERGTLSLDDSE